MSENNSSERPDRCETCRFWQRADKGELRVNDLESHLCNDELPDDHEKLVMVGWCRRFPPALVGELVMEEFPGTRRFPTESLSRLGSGTQWPVTWEHHWCGEWQATTAAPLGNGIVRDSLPQLLTVLNVAEWLSLSTAQVRRLAKRKELPSIELPNHDLVFDAVELAEWLKARRCPAN